MRILFVEDNVRFRRRAIAEYLAEHEVTETATVEEARLLLALAPFDAVLLDHDLPDGTGVELLPLIKRLSFVPLVMAISSTDDGNARLMAAGAHHTLNKLRFARIGEVLASAEAVRETAGEP